MAKEFSRKFYDSPAWRKVRKSYIAHRKAIDGGLCEDCQDVPGYIVDHKEELTPNNINDPMIALDFQNFQYLCLTCHNKKTFGVQEAQRYFFGRDGQVYPVPPVKNDFE